MIDLYTIPICPSCDKAKELLARYNIPYRPIIIGDNITRESVIQMFPGSKIAPIVVKDGVLLGGLIELMDWVATTDFSKDEQFSLPL